MVISYSAEGNVVAKLKATTFSLGATVQIGEYTLPGAGEYDVNSVHVEAKNLEAGIVYWLRTEDMQVAYLSQPDASISKHDEAASTDILVMYVRSEDTAAVLKPILKAMEPAYLFLIGPGATPELTTALSLPMQEGGSLKIQKTGLPEEGTTLILAA
jgi:hypothetical protein